MRIKITRITCALAFILLTISTNHQIFAQAPSIVWAAAGGGLEADRITTIAANAAGEVYTAGQFSGSATFGSTTLNAQGFVDGFIAKYDANGAIQWVKQISSTNVFGDVQLHGLTIDAAGNIALCGSFFEGVDIAGTTLTGPGDINILVAKFDPAGTVLQAANFGTGGFFPNEAYGIAADDNNFLYITGKFSEDLIFGGTTLSSPTSENVFVAKLNPTLQPQWAIQMGDSTFFSSGNGIAVFQNRVYLAGNFDTAISYAGTTHSSAGGVDAFITQFDTAGTFQWFHSGGGINPDEGLAIDVDATGNAYMVGYYGGTVTFGSSSVSSQAIENAYVVSYNMSGTLNWLKDPKSRLANGASRATGVAVDGMVRLCGNFSDSLSFGFFGIRAPSGSVSGFEAEYSLAGTPMAATGVVLELNAAASISSTSGAFGGTFTATETLGGSTFTPVGNLDAIVFVTGPIILAAEEATITAGNLELFPNPMTGPSTILLTNPSNQYMEIIMMDLQGSIVSTIFKGELPQGEHQFQINAEELGSGMHFIIATNGTERTMLKAIKAN